MVLADQNGLLQTVTTKRKSIEDKSYLIAEFLSSQRLQYVGNGKPEHYRKNQKEKQEAIGGIVLLASGQPVSIVNQFCLGPLPSPNEILSTLEGVDSYPTQCKYNTGWSCQSFIKLFMLRP